MPADVGGHIVYYDAGNGTCNVTDIDAGGF